MLRWRLIGAAAILAPFLLLLWADYQHNLGHPGIWMLPVGLLVIGLATSDLLGLYSAKGYHPAAWPVYAGNLLIMFFSAMPLWWRNYPSDCPLGKPGWILVGLALAVGLVLVYEMRRYQRPEQALERVSLSLASFSLLGVLFSFIFQLRLVGDNGVGMVAMLSLIVVVKFSDVGAYTAGRLLGRTKLVPRLSPGKTWEGAVGGVALAMLASWVVFAHLGPRLAPEASWEQPLWAVLAYGGLLAIAGVGGDLTISLLKRDAGQKDSGNWIPGLGGALDVIDSLLMAAPVAYLFWIAKLVTPQ